MNNMFKLNPRQKNKLKFWMVVGIGTEAVAWLIHRAGNQDLASLVAGMGTAWIVASSTILILNTLYKGNNLKEG